MLNSGGGTATLTNCTVSGNSSCGITDSVQGSGGGIYNIGTATLTNCTVSGNIREEEGPFCYGGGSG